MTQSVVVIDPSDGSEIDYTANYRPDKGMEIGGEAFNGETDSGGTIVFDDTAGTIVNRDDLAHGRRIIIREDASGVDIPIHMGRISPRSQYRDVEVADRARSITITTRDQNADLSGIVVDGWSRPAEEPFERIQALLAAYLNGASSTELNPDGEPWGRASTVIGDGFVNTTPIGSDMPAKVYAETDPREVIRDCCEWAGYDSFVILNDDETLDLFFDDRTGTAYTSTLSISDNDAQVDDALCFAPIWDLGPAHELDGSEQATGLLLIGGNESRTYDNRPAVEVINDKWEYVDRSEATVQADLNNNLVALLNARQEEELRIQFSMLVPADSIHLLRPGMRMEVKRAYAAGIGTSTYFRAVQVRYRWVSHEYYMVGVYLGYPVKLVRRFGTGRTVPTGPTPSVSPGIASSDVETGAGDQEFSGVVVTAGQGIVAFYMSRSRNLVGVSWEPTILIQDNQALTKIGEYEVGVDGSDPFFEVWYINNPTPSAGGTLSFNTNSGDRELIAYVIVNSPAGAPTVVEDTGTTQTNISTAYTAGSGDLVLSLMGWVVGRTGTALDTVPGDQTILEQTVYGLHAGRELTFDATWKLGGSSMGYTLAETPADWAHYVLVFEGVSGDSTEPVGDSGDPGSGTVYAPITHVHAHGDRSSSTATEHSAESIEVTPFSTIAATNVQDALEEIVAEATGGGAPSTVDYLVGTASGSLSSEIVVGTTPGGELGGTWASPTVDATHAGSTHDAATNTHIADATDAHDASAISYDNSSSGMTATDVQDAIDELDAAIAAGGISATIIDGKGELIVGSANDAVDNLAIGTDGHVLTLDSSQTLGVKWAAAPGGGGLTQAYVGYNTVGGSTVALTTRQHIVKQITLANDCLLTDIQAHVQGDSPNNQDLRFGIWTDNAGSPDVLLQAGLVSSTSGTGVYLQENVSADGAFRWFGAALGRWLVAGTYWIGLTCVGAAQANIKYDTSGADKVWSATIDDLTSAVPGTFTITDSTRHYSIRANTIR